MMAFVGKKEHFNDGGARRSAAAGAGPCQLSAALWLGVPVVSGTCINKPEAADAMYTTLGNSERAQTRFSHRSFRSRKEH